MLTEKDQTERDALLARLYTSTIGALELFHVFLGERLGLYQALASKGALNAAELAATAGINEHYSREWLEREAVAGILLVEPGNDGGGERRYRLPPGHAEVLTDGNSINFFAPMGRALVSIGAVMPNVLEAVRAGGGVPTRHTEKTCAARSPLSTALGSQPFGHRVVPRNSRCRSPTGSQPPARAADIGCGTGWSSIGIAKAYPPVTVDGFELDSASIEDARHNAESSGVKDRVKLEIRDAADPRLAGSYDLVTAFETIYDMSNPVGALRAMRGLAKDGGTILIADGKAAEEFAAPGDEVARFMYGVSSLHCLPVGMVDPESADTGAVMRLSRLPQYARDAGFADIEILPVETIPGGSTA